ncbi:MAG: 3-isopropylmalate dehydratase small subunit [Thermaerobacter sp.]|nr:3-isopropylmalate dehydratase small subunit [Thermaerobacter sp.]
MEPLTRHHGLAVPLGRANIDTDQIIPKQFLKRIERTGFGQFLFYDWRYLPDGSPNGEFILNQPAYQGSSILLAGPNFGCGSSREHAPWALLDYGFRVIIASSFADIFYHNCFKNGMLPLVLAEPLVETWRAAAYERALWLTVDLERQTVTDDVGVQHAFTIDPFLRTTLLQGLDDIERTLKWAAAIDQYEVQRRK